MLTSFLWLLLQILQSLTRSQIHALAFENQIFVSRHQVPLSGDFKSHVLGFESPTFPRLNSHIKAPFNRCIHGSFLHLLALRGLRYWGGSLNGWLHLSQVKLGRESAVVGVYKTNHYKLAYAEDLIGDAIVVTNLIYDLGLSRNCESDYKVWNLGWVKIDQPA